MCVFIDMMYAFCTYPSCVDAESIYEAADDLKCIDGTSNKNDRGYKDGDECSSLQDNYGLPYL